ncbi:Histone H4 [Giardia duodenalis assemblage B]|uniref:Histone H4 n=1 Tax=Giardia duodenalis assemblage B TaxID=1394984 RepID=A0A132NMY4_GIAIN|nr:Histone H4 [Giardia intestinalis assemblage B]
MFALSLFMVLGRACKTDVTNLLLTAMMKLMA